jgi:murein DD-endopeptidase MepM/ murein hydrolase activator NlpD
MPVSDRTTRVRARLLAAALAAVCLLGWAPPAAARPAASSSAPAAPGVSPWRPPVSGAVVESFSEPAGRYGPGHRGIDYAVEPGTPVRAAGAGTVTFSGWVAGSQHVVVSHAGGLRTSYSFLAARAVVAGERVEVGALLGRSGGRGPGHDGRALHFGLRRGSDYLDPQVLFRPVDLARVVRLVPVERRLSPPAPVAEGAALARDLGLGGHRAKRPVWRRAVGWALGTGRSALEWVAVGERRTLGTGPANLLLDGADAIGRWARDCEPGRPADHRRTSGHAVVFVAGIRSRSEAGTGRTNPIPLARLGYLPDETSYFSYAGPGRPSTPADTLGPIDGAARRLRDQLRAQYRHDSRQVDLVAHSMGGAVVRRFLERYYDSADPTLPPVADVVLLSSPLRGAPLGDVFDATNRTGLGRALGRAAGFTPGSAAPHELAETSPLMQRWRRERISRDVHVLSIGAPLDLVVPATQTAGRGAVNTTVDVWGAGAHSAITTDGRALSAAATFLATRRPACESLGTHLRGALFGNAVAGGERALAHLISLAAPTLP